MTDLAALLHMYESRVLPKDDKQEYVEKRSWFIHSFIIPAIQSTQTTAIPFVVA